GGEGAGCVVGGGRKRERVGRGGTNPGPAPKRLRGETANRCIDRGCSPCRRLDEAARPRPRARDRPGGIDAAPRSIRHASRAEAGREGPRAVDRVRREADRESDMSGRTIGNLILMTLVCVVIFVVFMAMRPAPAGWTPVYGPDGKYKGSEFDYGMTQPY